MSDVLYVTTDDIIATLGATASDMDETQLDAMGLPLVLRTDLREWVPTHATIYGWFENASATADQQYQADLLVLACKYFCAYVVARTAPVSIPQEVENPQVFRATRQVEWEPIKLAMLDAYMNYRTKLLALINSEAADLPRTIPISGVTASHDPVDTGLYQGNFYVPGGNAWYP